MNNKLILTILTLVLLSSGPVFASSGETRITSTPNILRTGTSPSAIVHNAHGHEYFDKYINDTNTQRRMNNPVGLGQDIPLIIKNDFDINLETRADFNNENDAGKPIVSTMIVMDHYWEKGLLQDPKGGVKKLVSSLMFWNWFK